MIPCLSRIQYFHFSTSAHTYMRWEKWKSGKVLFQKRFWKSGFPVRFCLTSVDKPTFEACPLALSQAHNQADCRLPWHRLLCRGFSSRRTWPRTAAPRSALAALTIWRSPLPARRRHPRRTRRRGARVLSCLRSACTGSSCGRSSKAVIVA